VTSAVQQAELPGIDRDRVAAWLEMAVEGARGPFDFRLIAAGGSNLTYRVTEVAGRAYALRRPPVTARIATAHDMSREWRIMKALGEHPTGVPVPRMLAYCRDAAVTGAEFYVMKFVDGLILRDEETARRLTPEQCTVATESLIDVQIAYQNIDLDAVGLGDLGPREGYVARQLRRWKKQVETAKTRELRLLDELHAQLSANLPPEQPPSLVHGDYRFDNTVLGPDMRVTAVLDWELCTIGDPIADFVWSLMYWADPGDPLPWMTSPPTLAPAFARRAAVRERFVERSGCDLSHFNYYVVFSWWKQACIVEGVYARLKAGARGGMQVTVSLDDVGRRVERSALISARACLASRTFS
jgi:aminoglycoside phosphotransferase (APT) family kinase protein